MEAVSLILMVGLAVIVIVGVFYRYALQRALPWYDEIAGYLLVWLSFYGAVVVESRGKHIGFEALVTVLPPGLQRGVGVAGQLIVLAVQAALVVYGWRLVRAASFDTAISLPWLRMSWVYSAIPISGALMLIPALTRLRRLLRPSAP